MSTSKRRKTICVGADYKENASNPKEQVDSSSTSSANKIAKKPITLGAATSAYYFEGAPPTPVQELCRQEQARKLLENSMMNDSNPPTNSSYLSSSSSDVSQDQLNVSILSDTTEHAASVHVKLAPTQRLGPSRPPLHSRRQTIGSNVTTSNKPKAKSRRMSLGPRVFSEPPAAPVADEHTGELLISPSVMQSLLHAGTESDDEDTAPPRRESLSYGDVPVPSQVDGAVSPAENEEDRTDDEPTEASVQQDDDITTDVGDLLKQYRPTTSSEELTEENQSTLASTSPSNSTGELSGEEESMKDDPTNGCSEAGVSQSSPNVDNLLAKYDVLTQMSVPRAAESSKKGANGSMENTSLSKENATNQTSMLSSIQLGTDLLAKLSAPSPNGSEDSLLVQEDSVSQDNSAMVDSEEDGQSSSSHLGRDVDNLLAKLSAPSPSGSEDSSVVQNESGELESETPLTNHNDAAPSSPSRLGHEVDSLWAKLSASSPNSASASPGENITYDQVVANDDVAGMSDVDRGEEIVDEQKTRVSGDSTAKPGIGEETESQATFGLPQPRDQDDTTMDVDSPSKTEVLQEDIQEECSARATGVLANTPPRSPVKFGPSSRTHLDSPARNTRSAKKSLENHTMKEAPTPQSPPPGSSSTSHSLPDPQVRNSKKSGGSLEGGNPAIEPRSPATKTKSPPPPYRPPRSPGRLASPSRSLPDSPARNTRSARRKSTEGSVTKKIQSPERLLAEPGEEHSANEDQPPHSPGKGHPTRDSSSSDSPARNTRNARSGDVDPKDSQEVLTTEPAARRPLLHQSPPPRSPTRLPRSGRSVGDMSDSPARNTRSASKSPGGCSAESKKRANQTGIRQATTKVALSGTPPRVKASRKSNDAKLPDSPARCTRSAKKARIEEPKLPSSEKGNQSSGHNKSKSKTGVVFNKQRRLSINAMACDSGTDAEPDDAEYTSDLFAGMLPATSGMPGAKDHEAREKVKDQEQSQAEKSQFDEDTVCSERKTPELESGLQHLDGPPLFEAAFDQDDGSEPLGSFILEDEEETTDLLYGGLIPKKKSSERVCVEAVDDQKLNETMASVDSTTSSTATESMGGLLDEFKKGNAQNVTETNSGLLRGILKDHYDSSKASTTTATEPIGDLLNGFKANDQSASKLGQDVNNENLTEGGNKCESTSTETFGGMLDDFRCRPPTAGKDSGVSDANQTASFGGLLDRFKEGESTSGQDKVQSMDLTLAKHNDTEVQHRQDNEQSRIETSHSLATRTSVSPSSAITTPTSMAQTNGTAPSAIAISGPLPAAIEIPTHTYTIGIQAKAQSSRKTSLTPTKLTGSPRKLLDHEPFTASPRRRTSHTQLRKTPLRFSLPPTLPRSSKKSALTPTRLKSRRTSRLPASPGGRPLGNRNDDTDSTLDQNTTPSKKDTKLPSALRHKTTENKKSQRSKRVNFGSPEMAEYNVGSPSTSYTPISRKSKGLYVAEEQRPLHDQVVPAYDSSMSTDTESSDDTKEQSNGLFDDTWDTHAISRFGDFPEAAGVMAQKQHSVDESTMVLEVDLETALEDDKITCLMDRNTSYPDQHLDKEHNSDTTWDPKATGHEEKSRLAMDNSGVSHAQQTVAEPTVVLEADLETALGSKSDQAFENVVGNQSQSFNDRLQTSEEEDMARPESELEPPEHTVDLEMSMEMILWPGTSVDESPLPATGKSKSSHRMSIAPKSRLSISLDEGVTVSLLQDSSPTPPKVTQGALPATAVPNLTVSQIVPSSANPNLPSLKCADFLLECVNKLSSFPISTTLHDTVSEVAIEITKVTPSAHDPDSLVVPSGEDNAAYFAIQEDLLDRNASAIKNVEKLRESLHGMEGFQYLTWLVSVLNELACRLSQDAKQLTAEIAEVDELMCRVEKCTSRIANQAAASSRSRLVQQRQVSSSFVNNINELIVFRQLEIASLKQDISFYEEEICSTKESLASSTKTLEQYQRFDNLVRANERLYSRDSELSRSAESKATSYSILKGLQHVQMQALNKRSIVFNFVGSCPTSCVVIEFMRAPVFECRASLKPDLFLSHHLIRAEKVSPVASFLRTRFGAFCTNVSNTKISGVKDIGPLLQKMECTLSGIDAVGLELASLKRNYKSSLVATAMSSGDFRFEVEFHAKGVAVMRAFFTISETYPHVPMDTSFDVFVDGLDIPFLFRLLAKNAKPGFGYLTRTVSYIHGFVATNSR